MKQILIVGSLNADIVQPTPRMPVPGETLLASDVQVVPGGKGANQAVAAGRLRAASSTLPVSMLGQTGDDYFGAMLVENLNSAGVDASRVGQSPGASGTACILVLPDGENLIILSPAANAKLAPSIVETRLRDASLSPESIVLCQLEIPLDSTALALRTARAAGATTILDPAPARSLDPELLSHVSFLTPNETEAAILLGRTSIDADIEDAARALLALGPERVILKLGKRGCAIADAEGVRMVAGFAVDAVDTTAAGDTFNGAFAVALSDGLPLLEAARFANAAAAISVTRLGAQTSIPTREQVDAFLANPIGY